MLNDNAKKILNDKVKLQDYLDNHHEHGFAYYIDFNDYTKDVYKHNEKHGKLYSIFTVDIDENILTIGIRKELTKDYKYFANYEYFVLSQNTNRVKGYRKASKWLQNVIDLMNLEYL